MSSNHHRAPRVLNPACVRYAALLPMLDEAGTDPFAAERAREHAAGCARCRGELATYDRLEGALRRHFGPEATPRLSTADLLWSSTGLPLEVIMRDVSDPTPEYPLAAAPHETAVPDGANQPRFNPLPTLGTRRPARGAVRFIPALSAVAAVAAVLVVAVTAQLLFAGSRAHPTGSTRAHATATPAIVAPPFVQLNSIVVVSPTEAWAAGSGGNFAANKETLSLFHQTGGRWMPLPVSCVCPQSIAALSLVSPTDIWAVGTQGLVLNYDGQRWTQQSNPTDPTFASGPNFTALSMVSATEGWALDQSNTLWHLRNGAWSQVKAPAIPGLSQPSDLQLNGITMISPDEGWAVGQAIAQITSSSNGTTTSSPGASTGIILHYSGSRWALQYMLPNTNIHAVAMTSSSDGWAAAESDKIVTASIYGGPPSTYTVTTPQLLRFHNGAWQTAGDPVTDPDFARGSLTQIAMTPSGDGWALEASDGAVTYDPNAASISGVLLRYHNGAWSQVALPAVYNRDSLAPQALAVGPAGDVWLVGSAWWPHEDWVTIPQVGTVPKATALILHDQNGTWTVAAS